MYGFFKYKNAQLLKAFIGRIVMEIKSKIAFK